MNTVPCGRRLADLPFTVSILGLWVLFAANALAQNPQIQERLAEIKQSSAANKQALAQYTWQEQDIISIKGEVKKQEEFQVRTGPDGKPQKTNLEPQQPATSSHHEGRLKEHVIEKKKAEFEDYAHEIAALAHSYAHPDPEKLEQAYQAGNLMLGGAGPGEAKVVISNYIKPKDSVTLIFSPEQKAIQSLQISSYLDDPSDAVTISVLFSKLPDGTNHVSSMSVNGESKKLTVAVQNSNYQKM